MGGLGRPILGLSLCECQLPVDENGAALADGTRVGE